MAEEFKHLLSEDRGEVWWVTINRPGDRNSLNSELMAELVRLLEGAEQGEARAVVFAGAGETHFIGGADGVEMMDLGPEGARAFSARIQNLFARMERSPLVLVAAIRGLCFGGGYEFALACDLRVAARTARIGLPEVKVGLIPGGGGTQRLPRLVGLGRALEMILSGRLYTGREAADLGLVHLAVEEGELESGVESLLGPLLRRPPYVLPLAKRAVYASQAGSLEEGLRVEAEEFSRCFECDFFAELMRRQLKEGLLQSTAKTSKPVKEGR